MKVAKPLTNVINAFEKLPGIGPKTAQRLAYYMLHMPQTELDQFGHAVERLRLDTKLCSICKNIAEADPCPVCVDSSRDQLTITVVEQPLDIFVFEKTGKYKGLYHVLHGVISPLDNIGPDELFIEDLVKRIKKADTDGLQVSEVIIATNPTMEGEATAMYLTRRLREEVPSNGHTISITRLGMGIPTGAYLEFADETTLIRALEGRRAL